MENFNPQFSKIGDILVYEKKLKPNELEEALKVHYNTTEKIGHILVSKGYINESDLGSNIDNLENQTASEQEYAISVFYKNLLKFGLK